MIRQGSITTIRDNNGRKLTSTRLCERHSAIDSLNKLLTEDQVQALIDCGNGSLTVIGFIIFSNTSSSKTSISQKLQSIIQAGHKEVSNSCSDKIEILPVAQYCLNLITRENVLVIKRFTWTDIEIKEFEAKIKEQSEKYWKD